LAKVATTEVVAVTISNPKRAIKMEPKTKAKTKMVKNPKIDLMTSSLITDLPIFTALITCGLKTV
jgi:hypothetical protein